MSKPQFHIYYDGDCPMCTVFAETVAKDSSQTLIDVTKATQLPREKDQLLTEIHLFEADGVVRTGADAVLTAIARQYPLFSPLARWFRWPLLKTIADMVYRYVAKRRTLWFGGNSARLYWLYLITTLGLLLGMLFSWPLWQSNRLYPTIPVTDFFSNLNGITPFLSIGLVSLLCVCLFLYKNIHLASRAILIFLAILILLDWTRLQPWIVHYGLIFALTSLWIMRKEPRTEQILDAARFVIAGIYFWSGFQKLNTAFWLETFPWFTEPLWLPYGDTGAYIMLTLGMFVPFIEMAFAIGLLTKRFRNVAILGSTAMLGLVLSSLVFAWSWNESVWPWNVAIWLMVITLFLGSNKTLPELLLRTKNNALAGLAICFCVILPLGNVFGLVDHYLAWSLYSGHVPTAVIISSEQTAHRITPQALTTQARPDIAVETTFVSWSMSGAGVVPYPEEWYFKRAFSSLCSKHPTDPFLALHITTRPFFLSHQTTVTPYVCK